MRQLYDFQKETERDLLGDKRIAVVMTGGGKTAIAMRWLHDKCLITGLKKVLIITTATKSRSGDMEQEADMWNGEGWRESLDAFEVISWHKLSNWTLDNYAHISEYVIVADEIQKIKGYTTGMGKTFRRIAKMNPNWTGYTATPGDKWIDLMPYFVITNKVRNKTDFTRQFCNIERYRGFPEIKSYKDEEVVQRLWRSIVTIPDTTVIENELPSETHKTEIFKAPAGYSRVMKTSKTLDGDMLTTTMGLCHYLRQICFTKEKQQWLADFIENLGTNCVFFCNYKEEEDKVCELAKRALPKGAKIWRIDGKHHQIPTPDTIGKYDIVVAHYASGGEALNLQFMHYWVAVSPNYSYSTSVQARGRIKRIGQKHLMFFYYLKAEGTIEDDIYACLREKREFSERTWARAKGLEYK